MRFVIYGAGAIGGVTGARLFEAGKEVILIARGEHLSSIQQDGLLAVLGGEEHRFKIPAVAHPREISFRPDDVVFLTMKSQHTDAALADLEAAAGSEIPVFCMQNGVENERLAARRFSHVYGGCIFLSAAYLEPGIVECNADPVSGLLDVGRYPEGGDDTAHAVAAEINSCALNAIVFPDIMRYKYQKLLFNLQNALHAACGPREATLEAADLSRAMLTEALAVMQAAAIPYASNEEVAERRKGYNIRTAGYAEPGEKPRGGSTWQSIQRGAGSVEADFMNGEIVLLGRLHGVPTPVNQAARILANRVARDRLPPGSVTVDEVRALAASLGHTPSDVTP